MEMITERSPKETLETNMKDDDMGATVRSDVDERYSLQIILQKAIALFEFKERAFQWMTEPNTHLHHSSPLELMSTNDGAETVFTLLETLQTLKT